MENKHPKIYKKKIDNLKTKVQSEYYYHFKEESDNNEISKEEIVSKIKKLFESPNYVYQVDINIMLKNGENIRKKVIALKDDYLITLDNEKIPLGDIKNIK